MNTGEKFLHPPEGKLVTDDLQHLAESAVEAMEQAFRTNLRQGERNHILWTEAIHSAAIENEKNPERIEQHQHALAEFLAKPLTPNSLLEMHRRMMAGQSHASPGRYRSIEVIIGEYHPPRPEFVPSLMDELFTFMGEKGNNQIARATWAHVEFESIHPFADGNGRAGRGAAPACPGSTHIHQQVHLLSQVNLLPPLPKIRLAQLAGMDGRGNPHRVQHALVEKTEWEEGKHRKIWPAKPQVRPRAGLSVLMSRPGPG